LVLVLCPLSANSGQPVLTGGPSVLGMHVRSLSHWAPANIGPYSQAISVRLDRKGDLNDDYAQEQVSTIITFYSGQIGLVPETMALVCRYPVGPDIDGQCWLALRHCHRLIKPVPHASSTQSIKLVVNGQVLV
uniref:TMEM132 domain-containing protein n=1 Tax=Echinostoma caproni TaxID=27848 RepID=A0A183BES8_9TREM